MFLANSEDAYSDYESSYIILFYEKNMRKRTFAKSQTQKQRIERMKEVRRIIEMTSISKSSKGVPVKSHSKEREINRDKLEIHPHHLIKSPMILEELLPNRDSKMRRFCNYFLTLFNQKKLNPFT